MFVRQNDERRNEGDLAAVQDGTVRGVHSDFGLAETHVAREQSVHGFGSGEVGEDFLDGAELVGGVRIGERLAEGFFFVGARDVRRTGGELALRVDVEKFHGDLFRVHFRLFDGLFPLGSSEFLELGLVFADVLADAKNFGKRHEKHVVSGVFEADEFALRSSKRFLFGSVEDPHPVVAVHDVVAGRDLQEEVHAVGDGFTRAFFDEERGEDVVGEEPFRMALVVLRYETAETDAFGWVEIRDAGSGSGI